MAAQQIDLSTRALWYGTEEEILALSPAAVGRIGFATDTQTEYTADGVNWKITRVSTGGAVNVTTGSLVNGGMKTADVYAPARDIHLSWMLGNDNGFGAALTANDWNTSDTLAVEISEMNPNARSIGIVVEASGSFDARVYFSRDMIDEYLVVAAGGAGTYTGTAVQINLPAAIGYDIYARVEINPDTGQTGDQLSFKAYVVGRGG